MKLHSYPFIDEHLPEAWLDGNALLFIDHEDRPSIVKGFEVHGQPMSNLSTEHLANWRAAAQAMLNSLEISTHLDCFWTVDNDYSRFISGHRHGADLDTPRIARQLMNQRLHEYEYQQIRNELRDRKLFIFVNFEPTPSLLRVREELRRRLHATHDHRMLLTEWKAALQQLGQIVDLARQPFEGCGMTTAILHTADLRRVYRKLLSPLRYRMAVTEPPAAVPGRLWAQTLFSDIERHPPFLHFDEHFHAFVSMTNLPQETRTGFLHPLFHLSHSDYALTVTLRTTHKPEEIRHLQSDFGSKLGLQRARERQGKIVNVEMETQAEEIRQEIRLLTQTPQQIFHAQLLLHLWHPQEDELRRRVDEAILRVGYCGGAQAVLERIAAPEALRACLPGWTREERLDRFHVVKSVNAADLIPAHTDFVGTGRPQLLFPTPEHGLMTAHVFTDVRPFHSVVVGETGGGKTFLINSILTQLVSQGLKSISVISTKDEFAPLMAIYNGQKISFREDEPVFLNPCAIAGEKPTQDELAGMTALLETIFGEESDDGERKLRQSRILKAAGKAFESHGGETRLRHFVEVFQDGWEHDDRDALCRLAVILDPYIHGGLYGEFFDSDHRKPLDLNNNFKFFDFSGIQKNKNLSAVMMMALANAEALRLGRLPRHVRKALVLDECWAFVDSAAGGDFIENALRVYRAFNCAVMLSSQVVSDFLNSRIAPVVMSNCHNFFLLRTKDPRAVAAMQKELQITDVLASRFSAMPDPSEAGCSHFLYVHRAESRHIAGEGMNRIGRAEALLYSTSPHVSQLRDHALRHAADPWKAVCELAEKTDAQLLAANLNLPNP